MKTLRCLLRTFLIWIHSANAAAQFAETFNDASLQSPVQWRDTASWRQQDGLLLSNELRENHAFSIYTLAPMPAAGSEWEWQLNVRLAFNPSSANYMDWFLAADTAPGQARNGYYVRIGNTRDEISLYRLKNGSATEIISGRDGRLNRSDNACIIRVRCREYRHWRLEVSEAGRSGWELEGSVDDITLALPHYQGFRVRQSTGAFHQRHFIDDWYSGPARYDTLPPQLTEAVFQPDGRLMLYFSEALTPLTNPGAEHYWLEDVGGPDSVQADGNPVIRYLCWKHWKPGVGHYALHFGGMRDTAGNRAHETEWRFFGGLPDTPQRGQLLITEIMAAPENGQPEWVEIQNVHSQWLSLRGCRFSDAGSSAILPDSWLAPGERCILQPLNWPGRIGQGKHLRIVLPALNNPGDTLTIYGASGQMLHRIAYAESWYGNPVLAAGAYSLEMMDTAVWCSQAANWRACTAPERSTPGRSNSIAATLIDTLPPNLTDVYPSLPFELRLIFDEWPDPAGLQPEHMVVQPGNIRPDQLTIDENRQVLHLQFPVPFISGVVYTLHATGVADCSGNSRKTLQRCFAVPDDSVRSGALLINEVLFDPAAGGVDFVELYNAGRFALDLRGIELIRFDAAGIPAEAATLAPEGRIILPGGFMVLCENPAAVQTQYPCRGGDTAFLLLKPMPALLAGGGVIALQRRDGTELDRMAFHPGMHHPMLKLTKGFSLERIRTGVPGSEPANWHSASEVCRGATPGRRNTQARIDMQDHVNLYLDTEWFTPDNDGHADQATLLYRFPEPGVLLSVRVFDAWGLPVRTLCQHRLCGAEGMLLWDGLRQDGNPTAAGNYIVVAEAQDPTGRQHAVKLLLSLLRSH
jgi:hypothetical protein